MAEIVVSSRNKALVYMDNDGKGYCNELTRKQLERALLEMDSRTEIEELPANLPNEFLCFRVTHAPSTRWIRIEDATREQFHLTRESGLKLYQFLKGKFESL